MQNENKDKAENDVVHRLELRRRIKTFKNKIKNKYKDNY